MGSRNKKSVVNDDAVCDDDKPFKQRVDALSSTWKYYCDIAFEQNNPIGLIAMFPFIHQRSLRLVLNGEWLKLESSVKRMFSENLKRCMILLSSRFPEHSKMCSILKNLAQEPWHHPLIRKIFAKKATQDEVCEFLRFEESDLLLARLEILFEENCEDLAVRLAGIYLSHLKYSQLCYYLNGEKVYDLLVALLCSFHREQEISELIEGFSLTSGLELIRKFSSGCNFARTYRKLALRGSHSILERAMGESLNTSEDQQLFRELVTEWAIMNLEEQVSKGYIRPCAEVVRKHIVEAESLHYFNFAEALHNKFGDRVKAICAELYVRGIGAGLSQLELAETVHDVETVVIIHSQLYDGFSRIGDLFKENSSLSRECLLTSFCLKPTLEGIELLKTKARPEECVNQEILHAKGFYDIVQDIHLDEEILRVSPFLVKDLTVLLDIPRHGALFWSMGWERLKNECENYLVKFPNFYCFQKETVFNNIDYSMFEDWTDPSVHESWVEPSFDALHRKPKTRYRKIKKRPPKRRGRAPKNLNAAKSCGASVMEVSVLEASTNGGLVGDTSLPSSSGKVAKRRGRPPKNQHSCGKDVFTGLYDLQKVVCRSASLIEATVSEEKTSGTVFEMQTVPKASASPAEVSVPEEKILQTIGDGQSVPKATASPTDVPVSEEKTSETTFETQPVPKAQTTKNDSAPSSSGTNSSVPLLEKNQGLLPFEGLNPTKKAKRSYTKRKKEPVIVLSDVISSPLEQTHSKEQIIQTDLTYSSSVASVNFSPVPFTSRTVIPNSSEKPVTQIGTSLAAYCRKKKLFMCRRGGKTCNKKNLMSNTSSATKNTMVDNHSQKTGAANSIRRGITVFKQEKKRKIPPLIVNPSQPAIPNGGIPSAEKKLKPAEVKVPPTFLGHVLPSKQVTNKRDIDNTVKECSVRLSPFDPRILNGYLSTRSLCDKQLYNHVKKGDTESADEPSGDFQSGKKKSSTDSTRPHSTGKQRCFPALKHSPSKGEPSPPKMKKPVIRVSSDSPQLKTGVSPRRTKSIGQRGKGATKKAKKQNATVLPSGTTLAVVHSEKPQTGSMDSVAASNSLPESLRIVSAVKIAATGLLDQPLLETGTSLTSNRRPESSGKSKRTRNASNKKNPKLCLSLKDPLSPIPAETAPVPLVSDNFLKAKLITPLQGRMNPKVVLTDIYCHKRKCSPVGKTYLPEHSVPSDRKVSESSRNDLLLTKSVPGMSSVDMIVPHLPETTVRVVQISCSNLTPSSQPVPSTATPPTLTPANTQSVVTSAQSNSGNMIRVKADSEQLCESSQSNSIDGNGTQEGAVHYSHPPSTLTHAFSNSAPSIQTRVQTFKPALTVLETSSSDAAPSSEISGSFTPTHQDASSTVVSAHIQRVGQPSKLKTVSSDASTSSKPPTTTTTTPTSTGSLFAADEIQKGRGVSSQNSPVYRFVVKDGRIVEQYYHGNQNLDPVLSIPDNDDESPAQSFNHDNFIKLFKKKNEAAKPEVISKNAESARSLPKFHQAFGRQMYQSGSIGVENSTAITSHPQYEENSGSTKEESSGSSGVSTTSALSKAVQTVLKDSEGTKKAPIEKIRPSEQQATQASAATANSTPAVPSDTQESRPNESGSSSGVIFNCKVPTISLSSTGLLQGKPVTILKASQSSSETIISTAKVENDSRGKDSVIRSSNMNALLAAALQNSNPVKHALINAAVSNSPTNIQPIEIGSNESVGAIQKVRMPVTPQKGVRRQPVVQQGCSTRFVRPILQVSTGNSMTQTGPPVVTIPVAPRTVVLTANLTQNAMPSLSKIGNRTDRMSTENASVSSTTLEQLREFESVLEQVTNTSQMKERSSVKKVEHQPTQTSSTDFPPSSTSISVGTSAAKVTPIFQPSLVSTISEISSERVNLTFINKTIVTSAPMSNAGTLITSSAPKITNTTPVVVVQSCSGPLASPAMSITSQNSLSPAPTTPPANLQAKIGSKVNKPKVKTSVGKTAPTATIKVSTLPKPQQKPQEDEQTTQRIYAILDKYAEQLRNSPELKNKPAPRRRSNPPTNPTQSSKRKKSSHNKSKSASSLPACSGLDMSPGSEDLRTMGSEDSSNGVSQISQVLNSPQSRTDEHSNPAGGDVSSEASESLDAKDQRTQHRIVLSEPSSSSSRAVLVQDNLQPMMNVEGPKVLAGKQLVVGSGTGVPLTLSLPGAGNVKQVIFPVPTDGRPVHFVTKGPKMYRLTMASGSSPLVATGPGAVVLRHMCVNKANSGVKQVKLPVVSQIPGQGMSNLTSQSAVVLPSGSQSFTLATSSGLEGDSLGITLDNTILLNASTSSSLGFFQRNLPKQSSQPQSNNLLTTTTSRAAPDTASTLTLSKSDSPSTTVSTATKIESSVLHQPSSILPNEKQGKISDVQSENEELRFTLTSNERGQSKITDPPNFASSPSNWVQMLKEAQNEDKKTGNQKKNEYQEKNSSTDLMLSEVAQKSKTSTESVIRNKSTSEGIKFVEKTLIDGTKTRVSVPNHTSDQWQFTVSKDKMLKEVAKNETSPTLRDNPKDNSTIVLNSVNQSRGMKRKINVENTIFQVAFKRSTDKLKMVKDEFVHQRNASIALERELRLQKSLSEECEDLGVDKPSTSDLFPEAELLLDSDPLSRDSLQELYTRGSESSSSSHESPERSPVFSDGRFSNPTWKKHKKSINKPKQESLQENRIKTSPLEPKSDSSCESNPLNGGSGPSGNSPLLSKSLSGRIFKPSQLKIDNRSVGNASHDSDNCDFSEAEGNLNTNLIDTDGESDSELNQRSLKPSEFHETESNDKTSELVNNSSQCIKCTYHLNAFKGKSDSNSLPWFHMGQRPGDAEGLEKNSEDFETDCSPSNGLMDDCNSNNPHRDCENLSESDLRRCRLTGGVSSRGIRVKKRFIGDEDSGSSTDAHLSCGADDLDRLRRRSLSRGRAKKNCPCLNGSPLPIKKKKDHLSEPVMKTEKPCKAPPPNQVLPPSKKTTSAKPTLFKGVTKKR